MPPADPYAASLAELSGSTVRLVAAVRALDDAALREPSLLPGWTRGHVVTHLARNADGLVNLATWARTGVETPMYPGGRAARDAEIERDAGRPASEQVADTEAASERLAAALADLPAGALGVELRVGSGATVPAAGLPLRRIREVEIHLVDLAAAYHPADWSLAFAERTLAELTPSIGGSPVGVLRDPDTGRSWALAPDRPVLTGPAQDLLGWLVGRSDGTGLSFDGTGSVPSAPPWQ
ncbi:MAG TPA: maleylpyruvate isomerase family mycothiol-dependent enzyme [Actinomycetes bacterium]